MNMQSLNLKSASQLLPERNSCGHKGTFGRVLLICGSKNMAGCCVLAAKGALRSGAGLVTIAFPDVLYNSLTSQLSETLFLPLETDERGYISHTAVGRILDEAEKSDVVMVGCGIGKGYAQSLIVTSLIQVEGKKLILDADALNNLADCVSILQKSKADILITPHPGEMARLMNKSIPEIEANRLKAVTEFSTLYNVNVLLKGHETLICNSSATEVFVNKTGNTGLSKGGAGDLLSGIIAGLAPNMNGDVFKAGVLGAFVHGLCADVLKNEMSEYSILPSDCADCLGRIYKLIEMSDID